MKMKSTDNTEMFATGKPVASPDYRTITEARTWDGWSWLWMTMAVFLCSPVFAANRGGPAISIGETRLYPEIELGYLFTNNAYRSLDNPEETAGVQIRPSFFWTADNRNLEFKATYEGDFGQFDAPERDYIDHFIRADVTAQLSKRSRLSSYISYDFGHVDYGTGVGGSLDLDEQIETGNLRFGIEHVYGAYRAKGNLTTGLSVRNLAYTSHDDITDGLGFTNVSPYVKFSYRLSGDTRAFTSLRYEAIGYDRSDLDRTDLSVFAGMEWLVTGKFQGEFGLGASRQEYIDDGRGTGQEVVAEGSFTLTPREYSEIRIELSRGVFNADWLQRDSETYQTLETSLEVDWTHEWSSRIESSVDASWRLLDRDCVIPSEDELGLNADISVAVRRWIRVGVNLSHRERNYDDCSDAAAARTGDTYTEDGAGIFVRLTL